MPGDRQHLTGPARQLIAGHLGLADRLAARANYHTPTVWQGDLHSAALEGLIAAAVTYDDSKGAAFTTWAYTCIFRVIEDQRRHLVTGRLDRHRADPDDTTRQGDRSDDVSIDRHISDDTDTTHSSNPFFEQAGADPADIYAAAAAPADDVEAVRAALATLTPAERGLMRRYYLDGLTLAAIAARDGITEGAVSYRLKRVRAKLRPGELRRRRELL